MSPRLGSRKRNHNQFSEAETRRSPTYADNEVAAMPRTRVTVPNVAEAGPGLWSNGIRAGDMLFISGQVARPLEGGATLVGSNEYEQARQIFTRIKYICEAGGGSLDDVVKMTIFM